VTAPAAGWFPDPSGPPARYRWWDGDGWTRYLTDDPSAPAPGPESAPVEPTGESGSDEAAPNLTVQSSRYPPGYERPYRPARAAQPRSPWRGVVFGVVLVIVIAMVGLAIVVVGRDGRELRFPEPAGAATGSGSTPSPNPSLLGEYDDLTRELTLPGMVVTMPDSPYVVAGGMSLPNVLVGGARASAVVQADVPPPVSGDWMAVEVAGGVVDGLAGKDVEETANNVFDAVVEGEFADVDVTIKNRKGTTYTEDYPVPVHILSARVYYDLKGVDSTFDRVGLLVAPRPDGGYNAWYQSRPNKADKSVEKALDDSINTLRVEE
jgi:hypothetical protein